MNDWIRRDYNDPTIRHFASKLSMHRCKIFCQKSNRLVSRNATNIGLLILLIFASQEDYFKRIKKKKDDRLITICPFIILFLFYVIKINT